MKHVLVFTMDGCPHCSDFKEMLTNEGIEYIEADINENEEEYNLFVKVTENEFVPAIMIIEEGTTDAKFYAPDRDFEDLEQAVTLIREQIA
jgi:glutaredoxin